MGYSRLVAAALRSRTSLPVAVGLCALAFGVFAASALAATTVYYVQGNLCPYSQGCGGNDPALVYRNFNDSCTKGNGSRNYGWTRVIYKLGSGTWVAQDEKYDYCYGNPMKAHLGPSTNYGYTYLESGCHNTDTVTLYMVCWTTHPS